MNRDDDRCYYKVINYIGANSRSSSNRYDMFRSVCLSTHMYHATGFICSPQTANSMSSLVQYLVDIEKSHLSEERMIDHEDKPGR